MYGSGCFIYVFHDFFSGDGCDMNLKSWGTTNIYSLFCVERTVLAAYSLTVKISSLCQVHVTSKFESQTPFSVGMASDPMALRRGVKKLAMEDVCYYQWPLPGIPQVFFIFWSCIWSNILMFFFCGEKGCINILSGKLKDLNAYLAVWSIWYLWWT
jgi:hypothetical protein